MEGSIWEMILSVVKALMRSSDQTAWKAAWPQSNNCVSPTSGPFWSILQYLQLLEVKMLGKSEPNIFSQMLVQNGDLP